MQKLRTGCTRGSGCVYTQSAVFPDLLVELIASRKLQRWMFERFSFVRSKVIMKRKPKKQVFKQLHFSHQWLITIGTSYCLWILVKQIVTPLNKHSCLCRVFCDCKVIVLKSYLKWWKVNSKLRFKDKNKILKVILKHWLWQ